ncbi:hypothetical protein [Modestobacter sp. VKM Ac-2978]|uniref:hypothetical protein n=1 Tax=Modestobacter sp. VKM Ac-2978 TaxID=3004132 RepID=UPI0022AA2CD9|nr:hypothetical protein [Modestobacter sp. VKM Ac-2978]MCZ2849894.1 hypothetical protein [Modestobacter sp. VKM Ac-2978]
MIIRLGREEAVVDEAGDTGRLSVVADRSLDHRQLAAALRRSGLGRLDDAHAWLSIAELRARCVEPHGASAEQFDAMVAYAAGRGWVAGEELRAHIDLVDTGAR